MQPRVIPASELIINDDGTIFHLHLLPEQVADTVILVGDPARVEAIAKYFDNSIREDSILTIAKGGIIYSPGSAGTMQEIFQEAVQNHYLSFGYASPMIFMNKQYWTEEMPVYRLMEHLIEKGKYKNLLTTLTDSTEEIVSTILNFRNQG